MAHLRMTNSLMVSRMIDDDDDGEELTKEAKNQAYLNKMQGDDNNNDGNEGYGKSTAGRNAWKEKHSKEKFHRKTQKEKHEHLHKW